MPQGVHADCSQLIFYNRVAGHGRVLVFYQSLTCSVQSHQDCIEFVSDKGNINQVMNALWYVSSRTESWGLKLLCYLLCLQGSDTEEKESQSSVTSSPNDKQIDPALWLWQSKQG